MSKLQEFRKSYPQYNDMTDEALAGALHKKYYSDMDVNTFNQKIGLTVTPREQTQSPDTLAYKPKDSPIEKIFEPVTDIPREVAATARDSASDAYKNLISRENDAKPKAWYDIGAGLQNVVNTGAGVLSAASVPFAPITGAARSLIGHPLAALPGMDYEKAKDAVDTALIAAVPGKPRSIPSKPAPVSEVAAAAERQGIPLNSAVTSENKSVQKLAQSIGDVPFVGAPIRESVSDSFVALNEAKNKLVAQSGGLSPETAGTKIQTGVKEFIDNMYGSRADRAYGYVDKYVDKNVKSYPVDPVTGQPSARVQAVDSIEGRYAGARREGKSSSLNDFSPSMRDARGLDYQGIKNVRGEVGNAKASTQDKNKIDDLSAIYGGLSDDMKNIVSQSGGEVGTKRLEQADRFYALSVEREKDLNKILGRDRSPEKVVDSVFRMGVEGGQADAGRLAKLRRAFGDKQWEEISSAFMGKLFDSPQFVTQYEKMSDAGKSILFGKSKKYIDDIHMVSKRLADFEKLKNHSNTFANAALWQGVAAGAAEIAFTQSIPWLTLTSAAGGRLTAGFMAKPANAKAVAKWAKSLEVAQKNPKNRNAIQYFGQMSRNLAAIANDNGIALNADALIRAAQGQSPAAAGENN